MFGNETVFAALNELYRLARKEKYWDKSSNVKSILFVIMAYVSYILLVVTAVLMFAGALAFSNQIMLALFVVSLIILKALSIVIKDIVYPILADVLREKRELGIPLVNE